jgi:hypothetical protein
MSLDSIRTLLFLILVVGMVFGAVLITLFDADATIVTGGFAVLFVVEMVFWMVVGAKLKDDLDDKD